MTTLVPFDKFYKKEYSKTQIYLHHTVSPNRQRLGKPGIIGDINWWKKQNGISTYCIIDSDGMLYKLYEPSKWAYHLGTKDRSLNHISIGIELDNLGPLIYKDKKFTSFAYPGVYYVSEEEVIIYDKPYRGHLYYERYTKEQIDRLQKELIDLTNQFSIPKHYNEDMWDISIDALNKVPGIYTHTSVRLDKSDCHPQIELIKMLKDLKPKPQPQTIPPTPIVFTDKDAKIKYLENTLSQIGWNQNINNELKIK